MNPGEWLRRVWYLLNRARIEADLRREMEAHREMIAESGGAPFGNALRLREESRDVWGWNWLDSARQDFRYACRTLTPGFALTAGLILSLGIGLNLALFQLVDVALIEPPPVRDPQSLVRFFNVTHRSQSSAMPWKAAVFVARNNSVLTAVLGQTTAGAVWDDDADGRIRASFVSANWFSELGYGPAAGRLLLPEDERPGAPPVAVLSHHFWTTRLGADPSIAGRTVRLNHRPVTVAGIAPAHFPGMRNDVTHVWVPLAHIGYFFPGSDAEEAVVDVYGRLRPGVSLTAARDGLRAPMAELSRRTAGSNAEERWLEPYSALSRFRRPKDEREMWTVLLFVSAIALLVFLIACANVGNLVLSRAIGRGREFTVRTALGAGRWRIFRQLLMESFLLAAIGAAGGFLLGGRGTHALAAALIDLPPYLDFTPNAALALAAVLAAFLAMLGTGLAPAWRVSRHDLSGAMKDGGQQSSGGLERTRLRKLLVAAQVAACCLVLTVAGMMVGKLQTLLTADPGFDYEQVASLDPSLERNGIRGEAARVWWDTVRRAIAAHPETASVALVSVSPLGAAVNESRFQESPDFKITSMSVEPGFFDLMKIPILAGRGLQPGDTFSSSIVVSRRVAIEFFGTLDVLGKPFPPSPGREPRREIVGVAADARLVKIAASDTGEMYTPPRPEQIGSYQLIARARTDAARLLGPMREAARAADSRVLPQVSLLREQFEGKLRFPRAAAAAASLTGLLALALACLGIYGVVAFAAALRTKEIGIRIALGSSRPAVLWMLARQQAWPLITGAALGIAAAQPLRRLLAAEPFYLDASGPTVPFAVLLLFALTAAVAALLPGLRALRLDPVKALRHD